MPTIFSFWLHFFLSSSGKYQVGTIQGCADKAPDVDGVYRLTGQYPDFNFKRKNTLALLKPKNFHAYNAQATLHFQNAFWGLMLPATVETKKRKTQKFNNF